VYSNCLGETSDSCPSVALQILIGVSANYKTFRLGAAVIYHSSSASDAHYVEVQARSLEGSTSGFTLRLKLNGTFSAPDKVCELDTFR
jgi:hypothetical protein